MSKKIYGGVDVICGSMLPPHTIYCSKDIFLELKKMKSDKSVLERLKDLYGVVE